jgi:hypothetical protein
MDLVNISLRRMWYSTLKEQSENPVLDKVTEINFVGCRGNDHPRGKDGVPGKRIFTHHCLETNPEQIRVRCSGLAVVLAVATWWFELKKKNFQWLTQH